MPVTEVPVAANDHQLSHHLADKVVDNQSAGDENLYSVSLPDEMRNRYNYDARSFEQIQLSDGKKINIPRPSAPDLEDPVHMALTGTPEPTPGFYRLVMPAAMARHAVRAFASAFNDYEGFKPWLDTLGVGGFTLGALVDKIVPDGSDKVKLVESFFEKAVEKKIEVENLKNFPDYNKVRSVFLSAGKNHDTDKLISDIYDGFRKKISHEPEKIFGNVNEEFLQKPMTRQDFIDHNKTLSDVRDGRNFYDNQKSNISSELKKNQFGHFFDAGLALIIAYATVKYTGDVYRDMLRSFAEVVAYEKYDERKRPSEVNFLDLFSSDNEIIRETCHNYLGKTLFRAGVTAAFTGRFLGGALGLINEDALHLASHFSFGELTLGVLGFAMFSEVARKDSSIFNDIINLIDNKLNPQHGASEKITGSDLYNLYQKYCLNHNKDKMFQDATRNDYGDEGRWESARAIFDRMAEMMNHTYKYKDSNINKDDPVEQIEQEIMARIQYYTLPKFLYLLPKMVDFDKPELTLACAEIANTYSIQAARQFWNKVTLEGVALEDALEHYVVDLRKTLGSTSAEIDKISDVAPVYKNGILENFLIKNPDIHEKYDELVQIRDAIKNEGKTPELTNKANLIIDQVRGLLNHRQREISADDHNNREYVGSQVKQNPDNAVNNVVKFERMAKELLAGANRNFN